MIDLKKEQAQGLLDHLASGRLSRREVLARALAAGLGGLLAPAALMQAAVAGEVQAANATSLKTSLRAQYDYIVVGAGSAGCAAARRILDNTSATVLVIEAGGDERGVPEISDPARWVENIGSKRDWGYSYAPSPATNNRKMDLARGKVLGGSSAINALVWLRGNRADYDGWAAQGAKGWDWDAVLPHLKSMEDWEGGASDLRGAGGPTRVIRAKNLHPVAQAMIDAGQSLGMPYIDDMNGPTNIGVGPNNLNIRDGTRDHAARAYLRPVMDNKRLTVLSGAVVTKLALHGTVCKGVEVIIDQQRRVIEAGSEVVLSAGAIDSPRLMMLSGLGPADALKVVDIRPVVNLQGVGQNLQDHLLLGGMIYETRGVMPPPNNNLEGSTFFSKSKSDLSVPDLMFVSIQIPYLMPELAAMTPPPDNAMTLSPGLVNIKSRGSITMLSNRHDGPLHIQPNILQEQADVDALVRGVELGMELAAQPAFKNIVNRVVVPKAVMTRAEKEQFVRMSATTYFHPVGTCKMGTDTMSVVDATLKVHGIERLRIADASVMPNLTSANTNVPSILIGEMAGRFISQRTSGV